MEDKEIQKLDEAIEHALEVAQESGGCRECKEEHLQLAEWLFELRQIKMNRLFENRVFEVQKAILSY